MNAVVDALAKSAKAEDEAPSGIIAALSGFLDGGQDRRKWLNDKAGAVTQFIPPELRPWVGAADMMNPISDIGRAGQASTRMMAPGATPGERFGAGVDMVTDMAGVLAPAIGIKMAGQGGAKALQEALVGVSSSADDAAGEAADAWRRFAADEAGGLTLPGSRSQADEIAEMLAQGRAGEVTDDMMAAADPSELWRLYEGGKTGQVMPMDEASRMARAEGMGFDTGTPLYRGDDAGLDNFRTGHLSRADIGVTTSTSPNVSATYLTKDDSAMYPVMSSAQNKLELDATGRNWTGVPADARTNRGDLNDVIEPKTYLDEDNLFDFLHGSKADWGDGTATSMAMSDTNSISRAAQAQGFDEVRFNNIVDRGGSGKWHTGLANDPHTTVMTANPANIRSKFARFDPRLKHLANLSAAGAGVAYMGGQDDDLMDETRAWLEGLK